MIERVSGTVKWFNDPKGYGFIVNADGDDIVLHYRAIEPDKDGFQTLVEGQAVEFQQVRSDKG